MQPRGPVDQLVLGEFAEDELVQSVPDPGLLPGAQPPPGGVTGPVAELRRQVAPAAAGVQHEQDAFQRGAFVDPRPSARASGCGPGVEEGA